MLQSKCYKSTFLTQVSMSLIYIFGIVCFHSDAIIRLLFRALWMYVFSNQLKKVAFKRLFAPFMSRVESDEWSRMNSHVFLLWWMMMTEHEVLKLSHWQTRPSFGMWMQGRRREDGFLFFCFSVFFLVAEVCACVWGGRDINQHVEELIKKKQDSWIDKNISYEKKRETNKEVSGLSMEHTLYREGDGDISIFSHSYLVYHLYLLEERLIWYSRYCLFLPHTHSHSIFQQLMKCIKRICCIYYSSCIPLLVNMMHAGGNRKQHGLRKTECSSRQVVNSDIYYIYIYIYSFWFCIDFLTCMAGETITSGGVAFSPLQQLKQNIHGRVFGFSSYALLLKNCFLYFM
jgi:hypothetical protein